MSTHAEVFVELEDGKITGTSVHFDGYPDVCGAGMAAHSYEKIRERILYGQRHGGLRFVSPDEIESYEEPGNSCIICEKDIGLARYSYLKRRDGGVDLLTGRSRSQLFPGASSGEPETEARLDAFLSKECGHLRMDDDRDRNELTNRLLTRYNLVRK
jgi:hypothetical protein